MTTQPKVQSVAEVLSKAKEPAAWRDMTFIEHLACGAIDPALVRYPVASPPKRFARHVAAQAKGDQKITDKQAAVLWRQVWKFRRQLPVEIVEHAGKVIAAEHEAAIQLAKSGEGK